MSRANLTKLCAALESFSVSVKPEEIATPTRAIVHRVLSDFTDSVFSTCHDAVNQPLACNLGDYNSDSAVAPGTANRLIQNRLAFQLLSKGSAQYTVMDIIKPDPKKFEKMIQQMVNYLYHSEKVYDLVDQTSNELDDKAARTKQEFEALDSEKNELSVVLRRVKQLEIDAVPDKVAESMKRHEKVTEESRVLGERYNQLKEEVKTVTDQIEQLTHTLKQRKETLAGVQALVVEDPDTCVKALQRLREEIALQKEQLDTKRCTHRKSLRQLESIQDALKHSKVLHAKAELVAAAIEELCQVEKNLENRSARHNKILLELDSHLAKLRASVEDRKDRLEKVRQEDREAQASLEDLKETGVRLKDKQEEVELRRRHLANEVTVEAANIASVQRQTDKSKELTLRQLTEHHSEQMQIWRSHAKEMEDFQEACKKADDLLEFNNTQLTLLSEAIQKLTATKTSNKSKDKK